MRRRYELSWRVACGGRFEWKRQRILGIGERFGRSGMRIALDATPLIEPTGGVARYTWELAPALANEGDEVWLVSDQPVQAPDVGDLSGVQWGRPPGNFLERRWWSVGLSRELRRLQAEVFHGTDFAIPYRSPCAAVMTIHDLSPWKKGKNGKNAWQPDAGQVRKRTPRMLRANPRAMVITPSEAVRREVIEHFVLRASGFGRCR